MNSLLQNGLLGMGGIGGMMPQPGGLLGQYYDPDAARKATLKNMLIMGGLGLAGDGWQGAARGAGLAAMETPKQFRDMAMDAYSMDRQSKEDEWRNSEREREIMDRQNQQTAMNSLDPTIRQLYQVDPALGREAYKNSNPDMFPQMADAGNGIFGTMYWDQNGNPYVLDQGGNMRRPAGLPEGTQLMTPEEKAAGQARGRVTGVGQGDAAVTYESMKAKLPGVQAVIAEMDGLAEKATYTMTGQAYDAIRKEFGAEPREAAVARQEYIAKARNQVFPMLRDTFGAQFTQAEGQALLATMGDPNMTPAEKQAVLKAKIDQYIRDMEAQGVQAGRTPGAALEPQGGAPQRLRFNPQTGELE
jgi:hypothetical protein